MAVRRDDQHPEQARVDAANAALATHPRWQELNAQLRGLDVAKGGGLTEQRQRAEREAILAELGISLPEGYGLGHGKNAGSIARDEGFWSKYGVPIAATAGLLTGGLALPALMGAGGAAGAAGAAGGASGAAGAAGTAGAVGGAAGTAGAVTGGGMTLGGFSIPELVGMGGKVVGAISKDREAGRAAQADYNLDYDAAERQRYNALNDAIRLDLEQREFADQHQDRAIGQRIHGDILGGMEDVQIERPRGVQTLSIKGGLRPSMMQNRKEIGADLARQATIDMLNPLRPGGQRQADGSIAHPEQGAMPALPYLPELSRVEEPGGLDNALDWMNMGAGALTLFDDVMSNRGGGTAANPNRLPVKSSEPWRPRTTSYQTKLGPLALNPSSAR